MTWEHTVRKVNIILAKIKTDKPFQYASWHVSFNLFLYYSYYSWLAAWNINLLWGKVKKKMLLIQVPLFIGEATT